MSAVHYDSFSDARAHLKDLLDELVGLSDDAQLREWLVGVSWPRPTRQDHERFCHVEEWRRVRDARGRHRPEVAALSKDEAIARLQRYWTEGS